MNKLKSFSVLLIALAFAATTAEAKGEAGTANGPNVHCLVSASIGRHIVVYPPVMLAIHLPDYLNGTFVLNRQHNQWVAYRATVYRYENGRWVYSSRGPWKATILSILGNNVLGYWVNLETGRRDTAGSGIGETIFDVHADGRYVVNTELYWYADEYVADGYIPNMGPYSYSDTRYPQGVTECRFGW